MSADENITISVDDTALSEALQKLDEALAKKEQLTGQPTPNDPNGIIINDRAADITKSKIDGITTSETVKIAGLNAAITKISNRIPILREAKRLVSSVQGLMSGNIVSVVGLLLLLLSIMEQVNRMVENQKREEEAYRDRIKDAQGFQSNAEFERWRTQQSTALQGYRSRPIIK